MLLPGQPQPQVAQARAQSFLQLALRQIRMLPPAQIPYFFGRAV